MTGNSSRSEDSVTGRLRDLFGPEVDPRVSIGSDRPGTERLKASGPESSGILHRLSEHAAPQTRYRLEGEIARGGMGVILEVWDEDLRRSLAMKMALDGGEGKAPTQATPKVLARFLEEAQVTGQLDHPGIVPVHELGLDERGQAYFTMRLVHGRDLEEIFQLVAAGEEDWTVTRALGVLLKACEAMAYAHDKGVIHRDLKPANLMVGSFGEVYVMDWGLARVQGHEDLHDLAHPVSGQTTQLAVELDRRTTPSGESTAELYTMEGDVVGTPAYMPPEQARGQLYDMSARSDVYSMGALLYRLLTGSAPFVPAGTKRAPGEILMDLFHGPPPPLEQLAPEAPAELVAICERAMQRDSKDRYPDMLALAEDLRAFLENRVVQAYETGALAETRKWLRRNKPLAISMAAGVLALVAGLVSSLVQKERADENAALAMSRENEAMTSAREAERQSRIASEVNRFLNEELLASATPFAEGIDVTVREVLDQAGERLEGRFADEPRVEAELRLTIGRSYMELGDYGRAETHLARAQEILLADDGADERRTLEASSMLGHAWSKLGRIEEAQVHLESTLAAVEASFEDDDPLALDVLSKLGVNLAEQGRHGEALDAHARVHAARTNRLGPEAPATLSSLVYQALAERELGQLTESAQHLEEAVDAGRRRDSPEDPRLLLAMGNLGMVYLDLGRYDESERLFADLVGVRERVLGPDHPEVILSTSNLGLLHIRQGRSDLAVPVLEECVARLEVVLGAEHPETLNAIDSLMVAYQGNGQLDRALELGEPLVDSYHQVLGPEHDRTLLSLNNLATLYMRLGRLGEAQEVYEDVHLRYVELLGALHPEALVVYENLGGVLYQRGDYQGSLAIAEEVLEGRRVALGEDHPDLAKTIYNLGMIRNRLGDGEGAEEMFAEVVTSSRRSLGEASPLTASALNQLARLRSAAKDHEAAAEYYAAAVEIHRTRGVLDGETARLLHQLAVMHYTLGDHAAAVGPFEEALSIARDVHGPTHEETLSTQSLLIKSRIESGQLEGTEELALEYHAAELENHGGEHLHVRVGRGLLAELYEALGREDEAQLWK